MRLQNEGFPLQSTLELDLDLDAADTGSQDLERALAEYTRRVAKRIGVPADAVTHEVTDTATAYFGLTTRTTDLPERDLMLVWDERLGWYIAIEPCGGGQAPVLCHLSDQIAPAPSIVARFAADVLGGHRQRQLHPALPKVDRATLAAQITGIFA